jgi:hypothetical protein
MCCNTFGTFAPIDENFAGIEVDVADLDVDELAHAYSRTEEQFEQDLVLHVAAVLDGDFGVNKGIENMPYLKTLGRQINRPPHRDPILPPFLSECRLIERGGPRTGIAETAVRKPDAIPRSRSR